MPADFLDELTGSFAQPARENPTVVMVEAAYRHHGLAWRYLNCEVAPDAVARRSRPAWPQRTGREVPRATPWNAYAA